MSAGFHGGGTPVETIGADSAVTIWPLSITTADSRRIALERLVRLDRRRNLLNRGLERQRLGQCCLERANIVANFLETDPRAISVGRHARSPSVVSLASSGGCDRWRSVSCPSETVSVVRG